jgi:glyoxylate carboligase
VAIRTYLIRRSAVKALRALAVVLGVAAALLVVPAGAYAAGNQSAPSASATVGAVPLATIHGCPAGWYCLYDDINWNAGTNGRRLQFQSCNVTQNLTDFGFNDDASSWVNNTSHSVQVFKDINGGGGVLWTSPPNSSSSFVGSANDQASSLRIIC